MWKWNVCRPQSKVYFRGQLCNYEFVFIFICWALWREWSQELWFLTYINLDNPDATCASHKLAGLKWVTMRALSLFSFRCPPGYVAIFFSYFTLEKLFILWGKAPESICCLPSSTLTLPIKRFENSSSGVYNTNNTCVKLLTPKGFMKRQWSKRFYNFALGCCISIAQGLRRTYPRQYRVTPDGPRHNKPRRSAAIMATRPCPRLMNTISRRATVDWCAKSQSLCANQPSPPLPPFLSPLPLPLSLLSCSLLRLILNAGYL